MSMTNEELERLVMELQERVRHLEDGDLKCQGCGEFKDDVCDRDDNYAQAIGGDEGARHTMCDDCDYRNAMSI